MSGALEWNITSSALGNYEAILAFAYTDSGGGGRVAANLSQAIYCRYLRRSLRAMVPDERDDFFKWIKTMMETPHALGEAMYGNGKDYQNIQNFVDMHLNMAAARGTGKFHDGMRQLGRAAALRRTARRLCGGAAALRRGAASTALSGFRCFTLL